MSGQLETLSFKTQGKVRKEVRRGRTYLVTNTVMMTPGVRNGSQGPKLYGKKFFDKSPRVWNGFPIVVNHPFKLDADGKQVAVSARDPEVAFTSEIGRIYRTSTGDKLATEAWFDEEVTREVEPRVLNKLLKEEPIEGSTGLYTVDEKATDNSEWTSPDGNKVKYTHEVVDYTPDHFAVLPDDKGACGVKDGCGVVVNSEDDKSFLQKLKEWFISRGHMVTPTPLSSKSTRQVEVLTENELSHDDIRYKLQTALAATKTQDEPHCYIESVYEDYFIYREGMKTYRRGYKASDTAVTLTGEAAEVTRQVVYSPVSTSTPETYAMNEAEKKEHTEGVQFLSVNCSCWKNREAVLNALPLEVVRDLKSKAVADQDAKKKSDEQAKIVANAQKAVIETSDGTLTFNAGTGSWEMKKKETAPVTPPTPTLDPRLEAVVAYVANQMSKDKTAGIERLTANYTDPAAKAAAAAVFGKMSDQEIQSLVAGLPVQVEQRGRPSFAGAATGGGQTRNTAEKLDVLETPVINWAEEKELMGSR